MPLRAGRSHADVRAPARRAKCDKDIDVSTTVRGVEFVAAQDNTICTSADIDTYRTGSRTLVAQAGGEEAAFVLTDVSDPGSPTRYGPFTWARRGARGTYTPDVKTFSQTEAGVSRQYVALSLERLRPAGFCGVVVFDVTDPAIPVFVTQIYKNTPSDFWCDVHNTFVEDAGGDGRYLYLTADGPRDLRVVDLAGVASFPTTCDIATNCADKEVGRYTAPTAVDADNYVHDVTVIDHGGTVGRRVYVAYWDTGLVVLNAADVTPGTDPTPVATVDPPGFLTHHAFASADGSLVFLQDEILDQPGDEPVQMWQIGPGSPAKVDGLELGADVPASPAHNLEIRFDLSPNRLYVGWYKLGLQAWDFDTTGFDRTHDVSGRTAVQYHQVQTEMSDDPFDGAWGVRMEDVGSCRYFFQSDRRYGLIIDRDSACT
ncbi:MAG: LVIVD repeat-containing protein [Acidimicrobiales bacterium]